jgi:hypothetical protein
MELKEIIQRQKAKLKALLGGEECSLGEIIFKNGDCQILSQIKDRFELIVYDASLPDPVDFALYPDGVDSIPS